MNEQMHTDRPLTLTPKLIAGIGLIFIGLLLALDNLGFAHIDTVLKFCVPAILMLMGLAKIRRDNSTGGYVLIFVGLMVMLAMFGHGRFEDLIGPMILVGGGILVITHSLRKHRGMPNELRGTENVLSGSAIFSGFKRRVTTQSFRGGELTAIFGGFQTDFQQASLADGRARLDVFILFGGGEIRVPQDWQVDIQATAIAGGIEDKTYTQGEAPAEGRPRLVITGMVLFGGVEIRN